MISKNMEEAINKQINAEFYSAYLYLSMAAYFESANLDGCATWMKLQAKEEQGHAMKLYKFLTERGGRVVLDAIEKPKTEWNSPIDVFEDVFEHEKKVTQLIYKLYELAKSEKDYAAEIELQWFITEQVEEESTAESILEKLKLVKDSPNGLLMMDNILSKRATNNN